MVVSPQWLGLPIGIELLSRDELISRRGQLQCELVDIDLRLYLMGASEFARTEAPAGEEPTPLSFRHQAYFGPRQEGSA